MNTRKTGITLLLAGVLLTGLCAGCGTAVQLSLIHI